MDKEHPAEESSYVKVELAQPSTSDHLNDTIGEFNDVYYKIDRRNKNTFLWITLQPNVSLYAQYGAMLAMSPELTLKKKLNFSFKEMLIGSAMPQTTYTGPGEVLLARSKWGDIVPIRLDGQTEWHLDRGDFLAMTDGVIKETQFQGFRKGIYSDERFFVNHMSGVGLVFVKSVSAIIKRHLKQDEQWIVNHGHLVAWNCPFTLEAIGSRCRDAIFVDEAVGCRFTGPGTVFICVNKQKKMFKSK